MAENTPDRNKQTMAEQPRPKTTQETKADTPWPTLLAGTNTKAAAAIATAGHCTNSHGR